MARRIQIVDLDGCISDDRWRRYKINVAEPDKYFQFHEYHRHCHLDAVVNLHEVEQGAEIIILTGRPLIYYEETVTWLTEVAMLRPLHLIMRNPHNHQPSVILKAQMVMGLLDWNSYGIAKEEIIGAIDDREDIIQMYRRSFGFDSRIVRIGKEEHENG